MGEAWVGTVMTVINSKFLALNGVAQLVGHRPEKQKVTGSIPQSGYKPELRVQS